MSCQRNPRVYMEITIGDEPAGRLVFELFADSTPKTAENFRALCTGERGHSVSGFPLHYKMCMFHRIIPGFMAQSGDFTRGDGTGGESIYGGRFPDENFLRKHTSGGLLSMANAGPDTNGSQFFVTFKATPHLDGKHVVFGRVIEGMRTLRKIENVAIGASDRPKVPVKIQSCGELAIDAQVSSGDAASVAASKLGGDSEHSLLNDSSGIADVPDISKRSVAREVGLPMSFGKKRSDQSHGASSTAIESELESHIRNTLNGRRTMTTSWNKNEGDDTDIDQTSSDAIPKSSKKLSPTEVTHSEAQSALQDRLLSIRTKLAKGRQENYHEITEEYKRKEDPKHERRRYFLEQIAADQRAARQHVQNDDNTTDADTKETTLKRPSREANILNETAADATASYDKRRRKEKNIERSFGWNIFSQDAQFHAYKKKLKDLPGREEGGGSGQAPSLATRSMQMVVADAASEMEYGRADYVDRSGVEQLASQVNQSRDKNRFSRRRSIHPDETVDYINERNRVFNKKIGRAFDKYTVEVRQNLERGTAL